VAQPVFEPFNSFLKLVKAIVHAGVGFHHLANMPGGIPFRG
jgi:hypothetical protein